MINRWRRLSASFAVAVMAVAMAAVAVPGPAAAAAPEPPGASSTAPVQAPQLVVPGTGEKVTAFQSMNPANPVVLPGSEGTTRLALDPKAVAAEKSSLRSVDGASTQSYYCDEVVAPDARVGFDESGAQVQRVEYYGDVQCNFYLYEATGVTGVYDCTPGSNYGQLLDVGTQFYFQNYFYGFSEGDFEILGDIDPRARSIEVVEEVYLYSPLIWGACNPLPNLQYLLCEGLGTNILHAIVSTGSFPTGLQDPPPLFMGIGQGAGCTCLHVGHSPELQGGLH